MTVKDVAQMLYENGVIKFPTVYELYIRIKNRNTNYLVGEYEVSPSMNYKQLNNTFTYVESTRQQVIITIPEGYTVDQIIDRLMQLPEDTGLSLLAPVVRGKKGEHRKILEDARRAGYIRVRADGLIYDLAEESSPRRLPIDRRYR